MSVLWLVEEKVSKRGAWQPCPIFPDNKKDAEMIARNYRERCADWNDWEYRVCKYVRAEESVK